ncbi:MAG: hypothetical protein V2A53_06815 [bacterium]
MKKVTSLLTMLIALGLITVVYAEGSPTTTPVKKAVKTVSRLSREVVSVDATANTITVKNKAGKVETLNVAPKAKIKKAGKIITLSEVSAGDKVTIAYKTEAGQKVAVSISVKKVPVTKATEPKQAPEAAK